MRWKRSEKVISGRQNGGINAKRLLEKTRSTTLSSKASDESGSNLGSQKAKEPSFIPESARLTKAEQIESVKTSIRKVFKRTASFQNGCIDKL